MELTLRNERVRTWLLNGTLLVLFACAWISDRWPDLTGYAIFGAFVIVCGEAIWLYRSARQTRVELSSSYAKPEGFRPGIGIQDDPLISSKALWASVKSHEFAPKEVYERAFEHFIAQQKSFELVARQASAYAALALQTNLTVDHADLHAQLTRYADALRPRASEVSTWGLAALRRERDLYLVLARHIDGRRTSHSNLEGSLALDLAKWKVVNQGENAFSVKAGDFEIEHFHGRTNIRVLDASRVTIEGQIRGAKNKTAPPNLRPAIYQ